MGVAQTVLRITGHQDDVNAVAFMDESSHIIASGSDDTLIKASAHHHLFPHRDALPLGLHHQMNLIMQDHLQCFVHEHASNPCLSLLITCWCEVCEALLVCLDCTPVACMLAMWAVAVFAYCMICTLAVLKEMLN